MEAQDLIPSLIDNMTYGVSEVFVLCILVRDDSGSGIAVFRLEQLQNYGIQVEKTINYHHVCYHFKHFQFSKYEPRVNGRIYEFVLYHHNHFVLVSQMKDGYNLYLSDNKHVPNGRSINSLKLMGNFLQIRHKQRSGFFYNLNN